jgi:hypothetical protein
LFTLPGVASAGEESSAASLVATATVELGFADAAETGADAVEDSAAVCRTGVLGRGRGTTGAPVAGRVVTAGDGLADPIECPHCVHAT